MTILGILKEHIVGREIKIGRRKPRIALDVEIMGDGLIRLKLEPVKGLRKCVHLEASDVFYLAVDDEFDMDDLLYNDDD